MLSTCSSNSVKKCGIYYFHFSIDNERKSSFARPTEVLPEFYKIIDRGRFFIVCNQTMDSIDIALSLYWVFHGADMDTAPPVFRNHRRDRRMTAIRIMQAIDTVYESITISNGTLPCLRVFFKIKRKSSVDCSKKEVSQCDHLENDISSVFPHPSLFYYHSSSLYIPVVSIYTDAKTKSFDPRCRAYNTLIIKQFLAMSRWLMTRRTISLSLLTYISVL